jgi:hypothetical protein
MTEAPAFMRNGRLDLLAINPLGGALYAPALAGSALPANLARFRFLDPAAADFYADLETPRTAPSPCCAPRSAATPTTTT